jgi:hypothetical protein
MREQGAVNDIDLMLVGELRHHLGAAAGVGAVILDDDLDRTAVDAAGLVDQLHGGGGGALVPAAIGGADARAMALETDADRSRALGLRIAHETGGRYQSACCGEALQGCAAGKRSRSGSGKGLPIGHGRNSCSCVGLNSEPCGGMLAASDGILGAPAKSSKAR